MFIDAVNHVIETKKRGAFIVDIEDILYQKIPHIGLVYIVTHDLAEKGQLYISEYGEKLKNRVLFATFPRTGNSFLRQYFEDITNIVTGSDMDFSATYEVCLNGFKGEGYLDDRVWIQKSHYPMQTFHVGMSKANRVITTIRNPLDTTISCYELFCTHMQSFCFSDQYYEEKRDHFTKFLQSNLIAYQQYVKQLQEESLEQGVPFYYVRYEDLLVKPQETLEELFKYMLGVENIEGTLIQQQIVKAVKKMNKGKTIYKIQQIGINKHRKKFNDDMIDWVAKELHWFNHYFGYTKSNDDENSFDILQYDQTNSGQDIYLQYLYHNIDAMKQSLSGNVEKWFTVYRPEKAMKYMIDFQGPINLP
ncbi:fbox domain containing protein [Stylonychia lemnae]|uniref:Fbox domain containing protein n=1 Tax=Stylonychia lemnae TaxID=5949 RepID=A0A077ZNL5_STYLE|nr:fbox domain containing protein [Stylonychia lemnae]|eukprot:CDW71074.1 fbox domain containing protein [Stylonychia lemnae]